MGLGRDQGIMKDEFKRCDGSEFKVPMFDPLVAAHFANPAAITDHLIDQMNDKSIYARIFKGKKDLTFLDIGANIGLVSLYATPACKRVVALEPAPDNFIILKAMTLNTEIESHRVALAPKNGDVPFFLNDLNPTASSTVNTYGKRTLVFGLTLGSILKAYQLEHVDICKCDAEGAEGESLTLEELTNAKDIIDSYYVEFHNCPVSTWEAKMIRVSQDLIRNGYSKLEIDGMSIYATK